MSTTRRIFPEAFMREAVDRVASSGLSVDKIATELGLHETVLRRWVKQFSAQATGTVRRPIRHPVGRRVLSTNPGSIGKPTFSEKWSNLALDLNAATVRLRKRSQRRWI